MAKRSASPDKLTIKGLSQDDQEWLKEESERLGCDPENLVRMMIRQRQAPNTVVTPPPPRGGGYRHEPKYGDWRDSPIISDDAVPALGAETEPTINEADESLDALMSAGPPLLDEVIQHARPTGMNVAPRPAARPTPYDPIARQRSGRGMQFQRSTNVLPYPRGGMDAFTETEFVGVNRDVIGSNMMGDARGNVMRDNLRHFGVRGTVNR